MDGFRDVIVRTLVDEGVGRDDVFYGRQLSQLPATLPSCFRVSKNWDVIVCKHSHFKRLERPGLPETKLFVAIELKSQDKSIGNNQNNRIEESIGNAVDFWESYQNKNFLHLTPRPWLGYLFVGRYSEGDENKGVKVSQPHFVTDPAFSVSGNLDRDSKRSFLGVSYAQRYRIFLERMLARKLYDGACFLVTSENIQHAVPNYRVLFDELSGESFLDGLRRYVRAYYPE